MSEETNNDVSALQIAVYIVAIVIVTPWVINGILIFSSTVYNALQPKLYEATVTYADGSQVTRRGTKKELTKWIAEESYPTEK